MPMPICLLKALASGQQCIVVACAGTLVHHVTTGVRRKGLPTYTEVHAAEVEGSARCKLEVLDTRQVHLGPAARALGWPETAWESLLRLHTGRTHQV